MRDLYAELIDEVRRLWSRRFVPAVPAIPDLTRALDDQDGLVRRAAEESLAAIAAAQVSSAAAKEPAPPRDRSTLVFVLGLLSVILFGSVLGGAFGFIAWYIGTRDLRAIKEGRMANTGRNELRWGVSLGSIGDLLATATLISLAVLVFVLISERR